MMSLLAPLQKCPADVRNVPLLLRRSAVGRNPTTPTPAPQGVDAIKEVSMVNAYCDEVNEVMYACVQFHAAWASCARARAKPWRSMRAYVLSAMV